MKKTIVRIVKEHFKKHGSIKGLSKDDHDHFYSELYIFLVQEMRKTTQEMVKCEKNELHENVSIPDDQAGRERDNLIEQHTGETIAERNKRLAFEEEFLKCDTAAAEQYLIKLQKAQEGEPEMMLEMANFYLRNGQAEKAEHFLRDAYSYKLDDKSIALHYACLLCQ
jgi:hypothetical protein